MYFIRNLSYFDFYYYSPLGKFLRLNFSSACSGFLKVSYILVFLSLKFLIDWFLIKKTCILSLQSSQDQEFINSSQDYVILSLRFSNLNIVLIMEFWYFLSSSAWIFQNLFLHSKCKKKRFWYSEPSQTEIASFLFAMKNVLRTTS